MGHRQATMRLAAAARVTRTVMITEPTAEPGSEH
jgi:hypothetical protein